MNLTILLAEKLENYYTPIFKCIINGIFWFKTANFLI